MKKYETPMLEFEGIIDIIATSGEPTTIFGDGILSGGQLAPERDWHEDY